MPTSGAPVYLLLVIPALLRAGKPKLLAYTFGGLALISILDWVTGDDVSLAALYMLPMMLAAVVLRKGETVALAIICALLRSWFDVPGPGLEVIQRFVFASSAYLVAGLFVAALVRNHQQTVAHLEEMRLEQNRRKDAEEQLRILVESSPAAIFTLNGDGTVLSSNTATDRLLLILGDCSFVGEKVFGYFPFFADALRLDPTSRGLRTAATCQGIRANGEPFLADLWFSSYMSSEGKRLAAIVVDSSDEMRDREEQGLRQIHTGNRIAAAAIAHEVRNFCEAMAMLSEDLRQRHSLAHDETLCGLDHLVNGLERIASLELHANGEERVGPVNLKEVLDNLRIVIEPEWREIDGKVEWNLPSPSPQVMAEPHGLLQAFMNLAKNSHRAVQMKDTKILQISVDASDSKVFIRFQDSGPGVEHPQHLFRPFQDSASGSGLGLYVSRFILRGYGGELRFDAQARETCFVVELDGA
ncbi:MAG TPA: ATP-binding protein [Bryobacteraceae bacterium]|nr:ATP-binding protein [Bryobacteraceae bacterium]